MPELVLKNGGRRVFVAPEALPDAIASGLYENPDASQPVAVEVRPGLVGETTVGDLPAAIAGGATPETEQSFRGRERQTRIEREHGGPLETAKTFVEGALNEATLGLSGAVGDYVFGDDYHDARLERQEANPIADATGRAAGILASSIETGGTGTAAKLARATPLGAVTRLGSRIAHTAEDAALATKIGRAAVGGAVEGGLVGIGQGVQQLADSNDPLTLENMASALSSNFLSGAYGGGLIGAGTPVLEKGLRRARAALNEVGAAAPRAAKIAEDLAGLDRKGLRAAEEAELASIEASRVPQRAQLAEDVAALRQQMKDEKIWLATKDADVKAIKEVREVGKIAFEADKTIDRVLRNPKALAQTPQLALRGLQQQEHALERLVAQGDNLRAIFTSDASGTRAAALDFAGVALEKNRGLQARIGALVAKPTSERLKAITDATDALVTGGKKALPQQMFESAIFGGVSSAIATGGNDSDIPFLGAAAGMLAPMLGAKASQAVGRLVFEKMPLAAQLANQRMAKAVGAFMNAAENVGPAVPVIATKVLSKVAFAPPKPGTDPEVETERRSKKAKHEQLSELYRLRAGEIRSQVAPGPDGRPKMRPEARMAMAQRLDPIAMHSTVLADRIETLAARRIEFLASKLPRQPELGEGMQFGPDEWRPSDMEMRRWARYVAAVEDPGAIEERLVHGTVTPEDGEVLREVYPERLAELKRLIVDKLPTLKQKLPYQRRLALSVLTGMALDPVLDPRVLAALQGTFVAEEGTQGGVQAPKAEPQFASVSRPPLTPAQERGVGDL